MKRTSILLNHLRFIVIGHIDGTLHDFGNSGSGTTSFSSGWFLPILPSGNLRITTPDRAFGS